MRLLTDEERSNVLRFYFVRDAKLALASALLKRHAIARFCPGLPWRSALPARDEHGKPVFRMPDGSEPLLFNVSHQAGLVVLLAVLNPSPTTHARKALAVGVDVVCPGERRLRDHEMIASQGWSSFVDIHAEVFPPDEVARLKELQLEDTDGFLEHFYAAWCLREAYVKMTGEALLAKWLPDLEMRGSAPPGHGEQPEAWLRGSRIRDVDLTLTRLLDGYMVGTAIRRDPSGEGVPLGGWARVDIEELLEAAEAANGQRLTLS